MRACISQVPFIFHFVNFQTAPWYYLYYNCITLNTKAPVAIIVCLHFLFVFLIAETYDIDKNNTNILYYI